MLNLWNGVEINPGWEWLHQQGLKVIRKRRKTAQLITQRLGLLQDRLERNVIGQGINMLKNDGMVNSI